MARAAQPLAAALALAAAACATGHAASGRLRPVDPGQAVQGQPSEALVAIGPVAFRVAIGGWRGQPANLEQRLTPVDVVVANGGDRPVDIGPGTFRLETSTGATLAVLTADQVSASLRDLPGYRPMPAPLVGAVGGPTFPGWGAPGPYAPGAGPPRFPVPPPDQWYATQPASGTLGPGQQTALLLFFETPGATLAGGALDVRLTDAHGTPIGAARIPFARE